LVSYLKPSHVHVPMNPAVRAASAARLSNGHQGQRSCATPVMGVQRTIVAILGFLVTLPAQASGAVDVQEHANSKIVNPIRRIISLLQEVQEKTQQDMDTDKQLFEKVMCACNSGISSLQTDVAEAREKIPQLESDIREASSSVAQLNEELKQHRQDKAEATEAVSKAKEMRKKEEEDFIRESDESKTNIAALTRAIDALKTGQSSEFLQTPEAVTVQHIAKTMDLSNTDSEVVAYFFNQGQTRYGDDDSSPASSEILGIMEQMKESMQAALDKATEREKDAKAEFETMMAAKTAELQTTTSAITTKVERVSTTNVDMENMKADLDDTSSTLEGNSKFLADLQKNCKQKELDYEVTQRSKAEEITAITDTLKILADGETYQVLKSSLPLPVPDAFLQVSSRARAHGRSRARGRSSATMNLLARAMRGEKNWVQQSDRNDR